MGLRERISAKKPGRLAVSVRVSDSAEVDQALAEATGRFQLAYAAGDEDKTQAAQEEIEAAEKARQSHFEQVVCEAVSPAEWEEYAGLYTVDKGDRLEMDWAKALPLLLSKSCVDVELRDETYWRNELASGRWSLGELDSFKRVLLTLNVFSPDPVVPKD